MTEKSDEKRFLVQTLVLAATGSIGVLALPGMINGLKRDFARDVLVMMSQAARRFISPEAVALFARNPVYCDEFAEPADGDVRHIDLARRAELLLVLPATANILGKAANGIADNLIATTILACRAPVVFVPSMNDDMWNDPIVQRNAGRIREMGHHIVPPARGYSIADMQPSAAAMPGIDEILTHLRRIVT